MAGQPSNFDAEIKKGMQPKGAKTSTNAPSAGTSAKAGAETNDKPKASAPQPKDVSGQTAPLSNTHQLMVDAGHAHMAAIHAHINSMAGEN
jgi:hypothetical protein